MTAEQKTDIENQYQIDQYQIKFNAFEREKELKKQAVYIDAAMGAVRIIAENAGDWIAIGGFALLGNTLSSIAKLLTLHNTPLLSMVERMEKGWTCFGIRTTSRVRYDFGWHGVPNT